MVLVQVSLDLHHGAVIVPVQALALIPLVADKVPAAKYKIVLGDANFEELGHGHPLRNEETQSYYNKKFNLQQGLGDSSMQVTYQLEPDLGPDDFIDVLVRSTLAERRPVHDAATIKAMLANADLVLTARMDGLLVGVSRAITDFAFCTYLSDLAVAAEQQGQGIGRALIRKTHEAAGLNTTLILLAAPKSQSYYPHIGMTKHDSCWISPRAAGPNR